MTAVYRRVAVAAALALSLGAAACDREESEPGAVPASDAVDGLSREEIERQVEPMSPARAESLGIVDTTIRIEPPVPDGAVGPNGTPLPFADTMPGR